MRRELMLVVLLVGCSGDGRKQAPPWNKGLVPAGEMGAVRNLAPVRGIVHLHSPYSHDACDGMPRDAQGELNQPCLENLRNALCKTAMGFAALTDHDATMADEDWSPELFLARGGDRVEYGAGGKPRAARLACKDGTETILFVGGENDLMPLMLEDHPAAATVSERHDLYNGSDMTAVNAFRAAGGLVWAAHTESKPVALLRDLKVDGLEVYNLHAAIDPDIREEWLGLEGIKGFEEALEFNDPDPAGPQPDLALLPLLFENEPARAAWETLLAEGSRVVVTAGTDAHENALPVELRDGERADSYRRMLRAFSNVALVEDATDPMAIKAAVSSGRMFVAFELLGTPVGFDVRAELPGGGVKEMGSELRSSDGATLVVVAPSVHGFDAKAQDAPEITLRVVRVESAGPVELAAETGATQIAVPMDKPGAYRAEVRIVPRHLAPYMGTVKTPYHEGEYIWIYANAIYVRP